MKRTTDMNPVVFPFILVCMVNSFCGVDTLDGFIGYEYQGMPYRLYIADGYDGTREHPLVLRLHGSGGRGDNNENNIMRGNSLGAHFCTTGEVQAAHAPFVLAPQCPDGELWAASSWNSNRGWYSIEHTTQSDALTKALAILDSVIARYTIDEDRIYVTGQSMGGGGTWDAIMRHPSTFAAAVPIAGHNDTTKATTLAHMALWVFHNADDSVVKPDTDRSTIRQLREIVDDTNRIRYTEYESGGHGGWSSAYRDDELVPWLFSRVRDTTQGPNTRMIHPFESRDSDPVSISFSKGRMVLTAPEGLSSSGFFEIHTLLGQTVYARRFSHLTSGTYTHIIDIGDIGQGIYLCRYRDQVHKMIFPLYILP